MNGLETSLISPSKFQTGLERRLHSVHSSRVGGGGRLLIPGLLFAADKRNDDRGEPNGI